MILGGRSWLARVWTSPPDPAPSGAWVLVPLSVLYRGALTVRPVPVGQRAPIPIVSVGSIWSGGAGKTPLAGALARIAREDGMAPAILLRGYGGKAGPGVTRVPSPPGPGDFTRFGDEACLHARQGDAGVYVSANRIAGARRGAEEGCRIGILDDGLQHRRLARDLEIVTLPAVRPMGNGWVLPRGPLREGPEGLSRADIIVLAHAPADGPRHALPALPHRRADVPVFTWRDRITVRPLAPGHPAPQSGSRVVLLCGIARPDLFRAAVEGEGYRVAAVEIFPDHHAFTPEECDEVRKGALGINVEWILTTAKDAERIPAVATRGKPTICVAALTLDWIEREAESFLRTRLREIVK